MMVDTATARSLADLDAARAGGRIGDAEYAAARARILATVPQQRAVGEYGQPLPWSGPPQPPPRRARSGATLAWVAAIAVLAAVVAGVVVLVPAVRSGTVGPTVTVTGSQAAAPPAVVASGREAGLSVAAACVSAPSRAADGTPTSFGPANMIDGRVDTAWRCDGDGVGRRIVLSLGGTQSISELSLIPGYAKTDPADGADRYAQNRRISSVRIDFDDGVTTTATFDVAPANRSPQTVRFAAVRTGTVTVTITGSAPGSAVGGQAAADKVAISELTVPVAAR